MAKRSAVLLAVLAILALLGGAVATGVLEGSWSAPPAPIDSPVLATSDGNPASKPGLRAGAARPAPATADEALPPPVDLDKVDRDLDLHGVVVTKDGKPVAGATLTAVRFPWRRGSVLNHDDYDVELTRGKTLSAVDGTFAIRLSRGEQVQLRAVAKGLADLGMDGCQAGQRVKLVMTPGICLVVLAKDEEGKPVDALRLTVVREDRAAAYGLYHHGKTDAAGQCAFDGLQGDCAGYILAEHDALGRRQFVNIVLPSSGEMRQEIVVPKGRAITGRVTDAETGHPIATARVGSGWGVNNPVKVAADGRYAIPGWLGDELDLTAAATGYVQEEKPVGPSDTLDFRLTRGFAAKGRSVDEGRRPIANARISAIASSYGKEGQKTSRGYGASDDEGHFTIEGLDRETAHALIVIADGFGRTLLDFGPPAAGVDTLDLGEVPVHTSRSIEGRVVDEAGRGVEGVTIDLRGANADRGRLRPGERRPNEGGYGEEEERRTDDIGRFRFPDLAPGDYGLVAHVPGRPQMERRVTLGPDRDMADVEIRCSPAHELSVLVAEPAGRVVQGVRISVADGLEAAEAETDAAGRARLGTRGRAKSARVAGFVPGVRPYLWPAAQEVAEGQAEVRFVLEPADLAAGVVLDPQGKPLARAEIHARRGDASVDQAQADADGRFEILVPVTGVVSLVVSGQRRQQEDVEGGPLFEGRVDGIAPGAKGLTIRTHELALDRRLDVQVLTPAGAPAGGAMVSVDVSHEAMEVVTGPDGRAEFKHLPEIQVEIEAKPGGGSGPAENWLEAEPQTVVPDGQRIVMRLRDAKPLAGRVLTPGGKPAEAARVTLRAFPGTRMLQRILTTDAGGRFAAPLDPALEWQVQADLTLDGVPHHAEKNGVRTADGELTLTLEAAK